MQGRNLLLIACLAFALLTSVLARPQGRSSNDKLVRIAEELTHTLNEVVDIMQAQRPRRRRRMVQLHIGRQHHHPKHYYEFRHGRRVYRNQRGGRNADISDH